MDLGNLVSGARVSRVGKDRGRKEKEGINLNAHRIAGTYTRKSADGTCLYEPRVYILYQETFLVDFT